MNYGRNFKNYKDELELALIQNGYVESELYSIIVCLFRESVCGRYVSIRDVTTRKTTDESFYLKGYSGFPDFVVLKREKIKEPKILGCIEIKSPWVELDITDQIKGHIEYFHKVIYTNGLVWKFLKLKESNEPSFETEEIKKEICLGSYNIKNNTIDWKDDSNAKWDELLNTIDSFKWEEDNKEIK